MSTPLSPPPWTPADAATVREALDTARAVEKLPPPSLMDYASDVGRLVRDRLELAIERALPWAGQPLVERIALYAALGGALLAALLVLAVAVRRWRHGRAAAPTQVRVEPLPSAAAPPPGDAAWWREALQRRLAAGRLRPALVAGWGWPPRRLDPPGLDPSWTSAELVRASGAAAMRAPLRRLDRHLWGGVAPRADDVRSVVDELGASLPAATPPVPPAGARP
jgi:hypothetical protein